MKKIVREYEFGEEQSAEIKRLAVNLSLTETTAGILFARGMDTEEKMRSFLSPSKDRFLSPFLMKDMRGAVDMLSRAKEEEWRVAVFGDYDADGIGASAIMYRALRAYGIDPYLYVPERTEGYGMSEESIDRIFDEFLPDLVITVDCGISNRKEVEYIKEQGAYVIVTDHHELPDELPDCLCINPKFQDDYPYDNLCGAGVALKVAQAIIGDRANDLLDFCALSTVADSVPLLGENRDIVAEGLKLINKKPRPAFRALLEKTDGEVTAQTLAFTVAPRINAAGRMGDARAALRLFTTDDESEIFDLAAKLTSYNLERQKCCEDVYSQAKAMLAEKGAYGSVVMLAGENWNAGFVGIVAARLAEEFARPALLFVRRGNMLKGSARSIESVNIFEALRACSEYIEEFGGHAQAAGINVSEDNFPLLENALNEYIKANYTEEDFVPKVCVSGEIKQKIPQKLAREINMLEPFGVGNRRPLFFTRMTKANANLLKPLSPHVSVSGGETEYMYFHGARDLKLLRSDVEKTVVFECNLSKFRGKEYLKGFIRSVVYDGKSGRDGSGEAFEHLLRTIKEIPIENAKFLGESEINALIDGLRRDCAYGLCVVAWDRAGLSRFSALSGMEADLYFPSSASVRNTLLLLPDRNADLSAYRDIVYLDPPLTAFRTGRANVYVCSGRDAGRFKRIDAARETLLGVFSAIRDRLVLMEGECAHEAAKGCSCLGFDEEEFIFALTVFEELGLIAFENGKVTLIKGKKTDLNHSEIYGAVVKLLSE